MAEINNVQNNQSNCFKEAVCINTGRIYDSCSDKDCLEDLRVYFTPLNQSVIDNAVSVKCRGVSVYTVCLNVDAVPFNQGFYSVDMVFYFLVKLDAIMSPLSPIVPIEGISVFTKKVILYGSSGNVSVFNSDTEHCTKAQEVTPKAVLSVVNPICLACRLADAPPHHHHEGCFVCPDIVSNLFDDEFEVCENDKAVFVSIGLFSIVQLERNAQMMIPAYDYCIPEKECINTNDDPCEIFKKIKFPTNEFFPPKLDDDSEL